MLLSSEAELWRAGICQVEKRYAANYYFQGNEHLYYKPAFPSLNTILGKLLLSSYYTCSEYASSTYVPCNCLSQSLVEPADDIVAQHKHHDNRTPENPLILLGTSLHFPNGTPANPQG